MSTAKASVIESQRRPAKSCKASYCESVAHRVLSYILCKHHMSSLASTPAKHHRPFHRAASRKIVMYLFSPKQAFIRQFLGKNITWNNWVSNQIVEFHFSILFTPPQKLCSYISDWDRCAHVGHNAFSLLVDLCSFVQCHDATPVL